MSEHPSSSVVEMDTVYNDVSNGPFIQTFMICGFRLMFGVLHFEKTAADMAEGLESVKKKLGDSLFKRFFSVILTDRGTEFTDVERMEALGCRVFYCDPMQSCQKARVENKHSLLRTMLPKMCDLKALGLDSQEKLDRVMSHLNSYPIQSLHLKTPWQWTQFLEGQELLERLGLKEIPYKDLQMNPHVLQK